MSIDHLLTEASDILTTEDSLELITEASVPPAPVIGYDSLLVEVAVNQDPILTVNPVFTDITGMVQTATTNSGRDNFWDTHSPGTATFTFNDDLYAGVIPLPNELIRVSACDSTGVRQYLFTGFLRPQAGLVHDFHGGISSTQIQAIDLLGLLAERNFDTPLVGAGTNVETMLVSIGLIYNCFPLWQTPDFDGGQAQMQDIPAGGTVLDAIHNLTFSDGGAFYVRGDGTVVFDDRNAVGTRTRLATSQVTFDGTSATGTTYAQNFSVYVPPVYTTASVTRLNDESLTQIDPQTGQSSQVAQTFTFSETASFAAYGPAAFPPVTGALMSSNTQAAALAELLVQTSNSVNHCVKTMRLYPTRVEPDGGHDQLDAAVQRQLRDRALWKNPVVAPSGFDCWVERIQHTFDAASKEWTCDLSFTSADQVLFHIDPTAWFTLGTSALGGSDTLGW